MRSSSLFLLSISVLLSASVSNAAAQEVKFNEQYVPQNFWSIYIQGGVSGYHDFNGMVDCGGVRVAEPEIMIGTKYKFNPWVRLGANIGWTRLTATNCGITTKTYVVHDAPIGTKRGDINVTESVLMDKNSQHLLGVDLNVDFNILQIWPGRKVKSLNLWAGLGIGGVNTWNSGTVKTGFSAEGTAEGSAFAYAFLKTARTSNTVFSLYFPINLSLEYDIDPRWTIGLVGHYDWLPQNKALTPSGVWGANAVLRFNFLGKKYKSTSCRLNEALAELHDMQDRVAAYAAEMTELQKEKDAMQSDNARLKGENASLGNAIDDLNAKLANCGSNADHVVRFIRNKSEFTDLEKEILEVFIERNAKTDKQFVLIGEASHSGNSREFNQKLSEKRTENVKSVLISKGISEDRISASAIGDSANGDESYRRVTIILK